MRPGSEQQDPSGALERNDPEGVKNKQNQSQKKTGRLDSSTKGANDPDNAPDDPRQIGKPSQTKPSTNSPMRPAADPESGSPTQAQNDRTQTDAQKPEMAGQKSKPEQENQRPGVKPKEVSGNDQKVVTSEDPAHSNADRQKPSDKPKKTPSSGQTDSGKKGDDPSTTKKVASKDEKTEKEKTDPKPSKYESPTEPKPQPKMVQTKEQEPRVPPQEEMPPRQEKPPSSSQSNQSQDQTSTSGERPNQTGTPSQPGTPGEVGNPSQNPGQTGNPSQNPGQTGNPSQNPGQTGNPSQNSGQTGNPSQNPGQTGNPSQNPGQTGNPSQNPGQTGMPGQQSQGGQQGSSGQKQGQQGQVGQGESGQSQASKGQGESGQGSPGGQSNNPSGSQGNGTQQGGGRSTTGGGGNSKGPGVSGVGENKDDTKPSPPADQSPDAGGDDVAPKNQPQTELTLRKLHDALQDDQATKRLEERTGMTREQLEQFAKAYEKPKSGTVAPGRELEVKTGDPAPVKPSSNNPGFGTQRIGTKNRTNSDAMPQDSIREMNEGIRSEPPPEWRGKWEGYKSRIARSQVGAKPKTALPKSSGGK